jgi:hypothetical protein
VCSSDLEEFGTADEPELAILEGTIEQKLEDYSSDLYTMFNPDDAVLEDHDVVLNRDSIAPLVGHGPLKGLACIERFFPELFTVCFEDAASAMERSEKLILLASN